MPVCRILIHKDPDRHSCQAQLIGRGCLSGLDGGRGAREGGGVKALVGLGRSIPGGRVPYPWVWSPWVWSPWVPGRSKFERRAGSTTFVKGRGVSPADAGRSIEVRSGLR